MSRSALRPRSPGELGKIDMVNVTRHALPKATRLVGLPPLVRRTCAIKVPTFHSSFLVIVAIIIWLRRGAIIPDKTFVMARVKFTFRDVYKAKQIKEIKSFGKSNVGAHQQPLRAPSWRLSPRLMLWSFNQMVKTESTKIVAMSVVSRYAAALPYIPLLRRPVLEVWWLISTAGVWFLTNGLKAGRYHRAPFYKRRQTCIYLN